MAVPSTARTDVRSEPRAAVPAPRCPRLGQLACQRRDDHVRGHVYHGAWAPDRHDLQD